MGLLIDETTIATSANVYVDGVAMNNVYIDSTLVWTKGSWKTAWSGSVILPVYGLDTGHYNGATDIGIVSMSVTGTISGSVIQVDANYREELFFSTGGSISEGIADSLTATKSTTSPTAMSAWYPTKGDLPSAAASAGVYLYLNKPTYSGSTINLSASTGYYTSGNYILAGFFEVTAIYYYA